MESMTMELIGLAIVLLFFDLSFWAVRMLERL
jgi:hypothetical protein